MRCGSVTVQGDPEEFAEAARRRPKRRKNEKKSRNPYSAVGLDKFENVQAELSRLRAEISAEKGVPPSTVKFVYSSKGWTPVIAMSRHVRLAFSDTASSEPSTPSTAASSEDAEEEDQDQDEDICAQQVAASNSRGNLSAQVESSTVSLETEDKSRISAWKRFLSILLSFVLVGRAAVASCASMFRKIFVMPLLHLLCCIPRVLESFTDHFQGCFGAKNSDTVLVSRRNVRSGALPVESRRLHVDQAGSQEILSGTRSGNPFQEQISTGIRHRNPCQEEATTSTGVRKPYEGEITSGIRAHNPSQEQPISRIRNGKKQETSDGALTMVVLLFFLVFCGRIPAIICTTVCWYIMASTNEKWLRGFNLNNTHRRHSRSRAFDLQSPEYKKKILETLERNGSPKRSDHHHHTHHPFS